MRCAFSPRKVKAEFFDSLNDRRERLARKAARSDAACQSARRIGWARARYPLVPQALRDRFRRPKPGEPPCTSTPRGFRVL